MSFKKTIAAAMAALMLTASGALASTWNGHYDVSNFAGGNHGLWMKDFVRHTPGKFNYWGVTDGSLNYVGTTATLKMDVKNHGDSALEGTVHMEFEKRDFAGTPKCEYGACPASAANWDFFSITAGSFAGSGALNGLNLKLTEFPKNADIPPQLGIGANSKNKTEMGLATWLTWSIVGDDNTFAGYTFDWRSDTYMPGQHGDINIALAPVPLPAAGWLLIAGLGSMALARRKTA